MPSYLAQMAGGGVKVDCLNLPDKAYINATKIRNVCKARIIGKREYSKYNISNGGADVLITSATGEKQFITRSQLCTNFVKSDGKRIRIGFMHNNKDYLVMNMCETNYKVVKLPDNCYGVINGKQVKNGSYIVCSVDNEGKPDRNTMQILSPATFRKMFKVPMQEVIQNSINRRRTHGPGKHFTLLNKQAMRNGSTSFNPEIKHNISLGNMGGLNTSQGISGMQQRVQGNNLNAMQQPLQQRPNIQNNYRMQQSTNEQQQKYKYTVTHKLVDYNNKHIGFMVQEIGTNNRRKVTHAQLSQLCSSHLVDNVTIVTKGDGLKFFRGNGVILEHLPSIIS